MCGCESGSEPRSSFWRGRPACRLTRNEPLDVVSGPFKGFFGLFLAPGGTQALLAVPRSGRCVCGHGLR